jgi:hypothetical protein
MDLGGGSGFLFCRGRGPKGPLYLDIATVEVLERWNAMSDLSYEELKAKLVELQKNLPAAGDGGALHFKIAAKGGVSAYGLGRYPVTLYYEQWQRLLGGAEPLRAFLEANKGALKMREAQA